MSKEWDPNLLLERGMEEKQSGHDTDIFMTGKLTYPKNGIQIFLWILTKKQESGPNNESIILKSRSKVPAHPIILNQVYVFSFSYISSLNSS